MAFTEFKSVEQVSSAYNIVALASDFLPELPEEPPPAYLVEQLAFARTRHKTSHSEQYLRECFISPILMETLRRYDWLNIWVNEFEFGLDQQLCGRPDYLLTSLPRPQAIDTAGQLPFVAVAEAKKENFTEGWGQCLAEMRACRLVNSELEIPVWGVVSTGRWWEFAKLEDNVFTRHTASFDLDPLGKLLAVLHYIFKQCDDEARKAAGAPPA